jgi:hypothetical protein
MRRMAGCLLTDVGLYWLDGAGQRVRLRLNMRNATVTKV